MNIRRYSGCTEIFLWSAALFTLAVIDPFAARLISFCPLENAGFTFCPGCGIGRSISFSLHGELAASFSTHILGIPALLLLCRRIAQLIRNIIQRETVQRSQS